MMNLDFPRLGTIQQAAEASGIPVYRVRQLCKAGTVRSVQCGRKTLVNLPALRLGWTAASHHRSPVSTGWSYDNENSRPACCSTPDGQRVEKSRQAHLHSHFIILKGVLQCESLKF